jgi:uncharacterized protein YceH (UPF0502 family)
MELTDVQIRILGCLVEKESATPDNYPLSTNALVSACNQSTNREPVVSYDARLIDTTMLELRTAGLARTVTGGRANKHKHVLDEAWGLPHAQLALLAMLFLRGPQTVAELRTRCERVHSFGSTDDVEAALGALAGTSEPYVVQLDRQPGQKERRWMHLLSDGQPAPTEAFGETQDSDVAQSTSVPVVTASAAAPAPQESGASYDQLQREVTQLRSDVDRLYALLGEDPPSPGPAT